MQKKRWWIAEGALLGAWVGRRVARVEDGQFTREYSRLYTGLVLSVAFMAAMIIGALLVGRLLGGEAEE